MKMQDVENSRYKYITMNLFQFDVQGLKVILVNAASWCLSMIASDVTQKVVAFFVSILSLVWIFFKIKETILNVKRIQRDLLKNEKVKK